MHARKNNSRQPRRGRKQVVSSRKQVVRSGNATRPPDNSGMVQIPRPIVSKPQVTKRTFKADYLLTTGSTSGVFFSAALYAPFYTVNGAGSSYTYGPPASLQSMYTVFGLYRVRQVQLIFEPLITSANIPSPFTVGMVFDVGTPLSTTFTQAALLEYTNSTKVSPSYPTEVKYAVPKLASENTQQIVVQGGWISTNQGSLSGGYGQVLAIQSTPITATTNYSNLTLVYEIWFKNPA